MAFGRLDSDTALRVRNEAYLFWDRLGQPYRPIPVEELARMCGIVLLRQRLDAGVEACLIPDLGFWSLTLTTNPESPVRHRTRRRFTIGHELGHFALPWQAGRPYYCRTTDIDITNSEQSEHRRGEDEASAFSAELLMPERMFRQDMARLGPDIHEAVRALASTAYYDTSFFSTFIRYITLLEQPAMWLVYDPSLRRAPWHCTSEGWDSHAVLHGVTPPRSIPASSSAARPTPSPGASTMVRTKVTVPARMWFSSLGSGLRLEEATGTLYDGRISVSLFLVEHDW